MPWDFSHWMQLGVTMADIFRWFGIPRLRCYSWTGSIPTLSVISTLWTLHESLDLPLVFWDPAHQFECLPESISTLTILTGITWFLKVNLILPQVKYQGRLSWIPKTSSLLETNFLLPSLQSNALQERSGRSGNPDKEVEVQAFS